MNNFSFSIQILALNNDTENIVTVVDKVIELIQKSGLKYNVGPFETTVEGDFDSCTNLLNECIRYSGELCPDVFANIKIHYKKNEKILSINEKINKFNK